MTDTELVTNAEAVKIIRDLAIAQNDLKIGKLDVPADLQKTGLPASVPILINKADRSVGGVKRLIEEWRKQPERRTGSATVHQLKSFIELVNRHKDDDSALFADIERPDPVLFAVIDYHRRVGRTDGDNPARFGRHRIAYQFPLSEELKRWRGLENKAMLQADFAAFLENEMPWLASPTAEEERQAAHDLGLKVAPPNRLVALARDLEIYSESVIKQKTRLQSGESAIQFERTDTDGKGEPVDVPGAFVVCFPLFSGGTPVRLLVRLRYRPAGNNGVSWFYQIYQLAERLREEIEQDCRRAVEGFGERDDRAETPGTGLPLYYGKPETD